MPSELLSRMSPGECWGCAPLPSSWRDFSPSQERKSKEAHWPQRREDKLEMRPSSLHQLQLSSAEFTIHARIAAPLGVELSSKGWRKGDGFYSRKNEIAVIACARAMASCRAKVATTPCPRSNIPQPHHGGSENGPLMASPSPTMSGVRRAGVAGRGPPSFAPPRGRPSMARDRGLGGYCGGGD